MMMKCWHTSMFLYDETQGMINAESRRHYGKSTVVSNSFSLYVSRRNARDLT